jgi:hypothetical protein
MNGKRLVIAATDEEYSEYVALHAGACKCAFERVTTARQLMGKTGATVYLVGNYTNTHVYLSDAFELAVTAFGIRLFDVAADTMLD